MRIAHLSSPGTVEALGRMSTMVAVHPEVWKHHPEYRRKIRVMSQGGNYTYMLAQAHSPDGWAEVVDPYGIDEVAIPYRADDDYDDFLNLIDELPTEVGVSVLLIAGDFDDLRSMYLSIPDIEAQVHIASVAIPVAPLGTLEDRDVDFGFARAEMIRGLVDSGDFLPHLQHHLYGMLNPVEAVIYQREFGGFIRSAIRSASSASLFLSALYGMQMSEQTGFYYLPPERRVEYIGTDVPRELTLADGFSSDQSRVLRINGQIISGFLSGTGGDMVLEEYRMIKEIGV